MKDATGNAKRNRNATGSKHLDFYVFRTSTHWLFNSISSSTHGVRTSIHTHIVFVQWRLLLQSPGSDSSNSGEGASTSGGGASPHLIYTYMYIYTHINVFVYIHICIIICSCHQVPRRFKYRHRL